MRILVTGGAGFIGSHLCKALKDRGHYVVVLDAMLEEVHGEFRDYGQLKRDVLVCGDAAVAVGIANEHACDTIVHLAAKVSVAESMHRPEEYIHVNAYRTARMMQDVSRAGHQIKRLIVASSMSVYGECIEGIPSNEATGGNPASVYGLTKLDQEKLCLLLGKAAGVKTVALRLFNVYGPGQSMKNTLTGVMANWAAAILRGEPPTVFDDGTQTRDFIHVDDVVRAFVHAVEEPDGRLLKDVYNVGTGVPTKVGRAAAMLAEAMGRIELYPNVTFAKRIGDVRHCFADVWRANDHLGFRSEIELSKGLASYAAWVLDNCKGEEWRKSNPKSESVAPAT